MQDDTQRKVTALEGLAFNSLKQLISWRDDFKVNESQIDHQHENIFRLAVQASELAKEPAAHEKLIEVFEAFGGFLQEHFRYEEAMLAEIGYPKLDAHRAEHTAMLSEFEFIRQRLSSGGEGWVLQERALVVVNFMLGVTVGHILSSDVNYARHMQQTTEGA